MSINDKNLPQSLVNLEFKDQAPFDSFCEESPFEKILHRHWKEKSFLDRQRKIAEEYQNLRHAVLEMNEAEMAYHMMMQMRNKLIYAYRHLLNNAS